MERNQSSWELYSQILSQENINLQYDDNAETASFNLETRTVTVPTFKFLDDETTMMLVSHEVGHALYTKYSDEDFSSYKKKYNDLFNVVEDAFIERRIKEKYKGLKTVFKNAYKTLFENEFFSYDESDEYNLISRLNLFAKIGFLKEIEFEGKENEFATRLMMLKSSEDVIQLCEDVYSFLKMKKRKVKEELEKSNEGSEKPYESDSDENNNEEDNTSNSNENDSSESNQNDNDSSSSESDSNFNNHEDNEEENIDDELIDALQTEFEKNLEEYGYNQTQLNNNKNCNIVSLDSKVYDDTKVAIFDLYPYMKKQSNSNFDKTIKFIKTLAKSADSLFNQMKTASEMKSVKNRLTGSVDKRKLAKYLTTDTIFQMKQIKKEGKSHGLIVLVDYSSSMCCDNIMKNTMIQACVLGEFCKMNKIPFEIIAFGLEIHQYDIIDKTKPYYNKKFFVRNSPKVIANNLNFDLEALLILGYSNVIHILENPEDDSYRRIEIGHGGTPTIEGLLSCISTISNFKRNGIDKTSIYVITDGFHNEKFYDYKTMFNNQEKDCTYKYFNSYHTKRIIIDGVMIDIDKILSEEQKNNLSVFYELSEWIIELICYHIKKSFGTYISFNLMMSFNELKYHDEALERIFNREKSNFNRTSSMLMCVYYLKFKKIFNTIKRCDVDFDKKSIITLNYENNPFMDQFKMLNTKDIKTTIKKGSENYLSETLNKIKLFKEYVCEYIKNIA